MLDRLKQRLVKWIGPDILKTNPVGFLENSMPGQSGPQRPEEDLAHGVAVYSVDVWAHASIRAIAEAVGSTDLIVQSSVEKDGVLTWEPDTQHQLNELLANPNPVDPLPQLITTFVSALLAAGNSHFAYDPVDNELYYVNPTWPTVNTDSNGVITSFSVSSKGQTKVLAPEMIVHAKLTSLTDSFYGLPPSRVVRGAILAKLSLVKLLKNYFANMGMPGLSFSTDQELSQEQRQRIRQELKLLYGSTNQFDAAILDLGQKLDVMSHNLKDLVPVELTKMIREEVLAVYGVPPVMVGVLDGASYANANIQKRFFVINRVIPIAKLVENYLNLQLVNFYYPDEGVRLHFDTEGLAAKQEDETEKSNRAITQFQGGIITLNESRNIIGRPAVDEGEDFFAPPAISFGSPAEDGAEEDESKAFPAPKSFDRYEIALKQFWQGQLFRLIERLKKLTANGKVMINLETRLIKKDIDPDDVGSWFNLKDENNKLGKAMGGVVLSLIKQFGRSATQQVRSGVAFNVRDPRVVDMINDLTKRLVHINGTTVDVLQGILKEGVESGNAFRTIVNKLRDTYTDFDKVRATKVAQTEMTGIFNGSKEAGYRQSGVTHKQWVTTQDGLARDSHVLQDGETVKIGAEFNITGLKFPGDPNGLPEETINCRCSIVPIFKES